MKNIFILQNTIMRVAPVLPKAVLAPVLPLSHRGKEKARQGLWLTDIHMKDQTKRVIWLLMLVSPEYVILICIF
jgi:hypothetical protein